VLRQSCGRMVGPGEEAEVFVPTPSLSELSEMKSRKSRPRKTAPQ